ncbi:MAG: RNA polymerase sigma factor [Myxococcota bacterium]
MKVREYLHKASLPSEHETPSEAEVQRLTLTGQYVTQHALAVRAEAWNLYIQHFGTALNKTIKSVLFYHRGYGQEFESELLQNGLVQPFLTLLRKANVLEIKCLDAWLFSAARQATRKNLFLLRKDQKLEPLAIPGTEEDKGMGPELPSTQEGVPFDENAMITRLYNQQRSEALNQALDMLSPAERTLIEQYFEQDRTLKEIGEVLVLHESTVLYRIRKVLQKLRQLLKTHKPETASHDKKKP